jgi:citrate lyase beta subunit
VIHPSQIPIVQHAFAPSQEQLQFAQGVLAAFDEATAKASRQQDRQRARGQQLPSLR